MGEVDIWWFVFFGGGLEFELEFTDDEFVKIFFLGGGMGLLSFFNLLFPPPELESLEARWGF